LGQTNRNGDHESLMLSKSDNKSLILNEKESLKEQSVLHSNCTNSAIIKNSQKSAQSFTIPLPVPAKVSSLDKSVQA
jgi:hypothetical protein